MRRGQEYSSHREETSSRTTERHVTSRQVTSQVQGMLVQEGILTQSIDGTPPVFERVFSNARFAQGGNALFEGRVVGQPKPIVSWTRKGAPLLESAKYKLKYEEQTGNVSLQINNIGPGDEGEYTCTARNQLGEAICSVYIQPEGFAVPAHQQGIRQEMTQIKQTQQTLQSGYQQTQTTQRTQQLQQTMQYSNGFTSIEEDFKVDTFEYRILREVSFRESLTRRYVGESDAVIETRVDPLLGPPAPPQVQTKPRNSKQTEGADVIFTAKVPANPKPRLTWFKNGKRVVSSQKHQTSYANQQASLKINHVSAQDSGHYTFLAENPQGCVVTSAYLAVEPTKTQEQFYEREILKTEESVEGKMIAPNFVRACADREVTEGKMTRFDCRVTGRPYPEVTWYINGRQVTDDATHKILVNESGNHALMITNITHLDSGTVTCIAKNKAGESSFECKLNVIEKELVVAPQFVQRFSGISIREGDSFMLTARAVGTPVPNISWQKDGVPVMSCPGLRITVDGGSSSLEVVDAKATDAGWYQCTAQNMAGSTATRARVHVQKIIKQDTSQPSRLHLPTPTTIIQPAPAPEPEVIYLRHVERAAPKAPRYEEERHYPPPQFIIPLTDATQVEGSKIHLEARVEPVGDPTMNVDWYHNGRPLPASSRLTATFRFGFIALDLLSVVPEDAGEYTCVVQSSTGHAQSTSKVTITSRASIEAKSQYPESLEYIRQLEDYSKYQRSESIEETTSARPVFIRPLRDLGQTQEGRNAHLEGQITPVSDPTMRVDWFKDGKPITASSRITTIFNFGYVSLNILHLRSEDSGIYTVRAVNRWGEAVSQSSLIVIARSSVTGELGIPEQQRYIESVEALEGYLSSSHRVAPEPPESTQPPIFQSPIKDQGVREGGFAHFEARLEPVGDSTLRVEWLKDGRPVEASSRITTFFNFGYVALTIKSVATHDAGKYSCHAYNRLGEASTSAILNVISKQDSVVFDSQHASSLQKIQHLEDSSRYMKSKQEEVTVTQKPRFLGPLKGTNKIVEGQRAHFEARVEPLSDTTMIIEWYFNGRILQTANRIQTYHDFGYVALDIMSVRAEDAGTYTVVARNALGEVQLSATMHVETRSSIDTRSMHHGAYDKTKHIEDRAHIEPQYNIEEISKSRPIFVQPLSDVPPLSEGKNVHLECRLEPMGDPTMRVEWFLNGKAITVGSRFRTYYDFGYVALDIIHATSLDSGEYTVRATNHLGSAHTSACVRVMSRSDIVTETQNESSLEQIELLESRGRRMEREEAVIAAPPVFTRPLHNIETLEGTNVHLECRLQPVGDPTMRVEWLVNGKPVRVGHRFRPAYDFDYVALDLLSVYPEDSGVYTCIARNHLGETVTSSSVRVIAKKDLLLESQHPGGLEKIQYLEDSSRYKRSDIVDEIVTVKPRFITKPKSIEGLRESGHAHFECKLEPVTDANLKVEWFKNGRPIIVGHRFRPIHDFGYVALDIIDTIAEDSGIYTCHATNLLGTDETSCSLKCLRSSQIVTTTQNEAGLEQIQYLEDRSKYQRKEEIEETTRQAPVFTTSLKQCDIREGQRAHFECRLIPVSDNTMKVEWFHNGQPVKSGSRFTETNNFGFVALDILHCLPEDSGTYTCRAKNINGQAVTSSILNVQSRKSIYLESQHESALSRLNQFETREYHGPSGPEDAPSQPPVFTQPCKDLRLAEGSSAHFEARLIPVGDARLKVEWLRNGVPIQASNRITTMHDFGYVALNMKHVYAEDSGTYTCRAVNDLGQAVTSATLFVQSKASLLTESQHEAALQKLQALEDSSKYKRTEEEEIVVAQKPNFSVQLNGPTTLMEGQSAHYECRIEPYPDANLKVEWFHNGKPLQTGHRFRTAFDFGFATLDILTVYEEDKGEYTCKAINKLGQGVSSVKLNVQSRASIIRDTQHKEALQKIQYLEDDSRYKRTIEEEVTVHERPEFGRPLKNIEHLPEGRMAHLEATLTPVNDPTMKVDWFRNGRPIPQGHRFKTTYDFGFVALDILYAYAEDSGTYMCKARNIAGEAVTTCSVQVDSKAGLQLDTLDEQRLKKIKELEHYERPRQEEIEPLPQKPVFITPLNSLENLKEGDHAHLECRVEPISDANLRIEWFVNGKAIKTGHRFRTTHDFGYVALDILYVYAEDSGTYMCKATNLMGEAVNTSTIRVQSRHNILLETQHPEGLEKIRELEAQGHPTRLEIEEPIPNPPRFITQLRGTTEIVEGGTAHFEAQIEPLHDPNLRVEVYHNGKPLGSASRFHITFDFGYFALDVGHCLASDAGEYTVKAINKLGSAVSSTTLKVVERGSVILDSQRPEGLEKIRELEREAPKRPEAAEPVTRQRPVFTQPLQNIDSIVEGQIAHFECRLIPVGDPTLKVEWFRNEKILEDSSRITKTHDFGYVSMDMTHVREEDEGVYMCRASNALGEAVTTASMKIKSKASIQLDTQHPEGMRKIRQLEEGRGPLKPEDIEPIFEKPIFTQVLTGPSELWEGQTAHFEARVVPVGDPTMRYHWYVNGVELKMGSRLHVTHDFGFVTLDIMSTVPEDSGLYMCKAVNSAGEAVSSTTLKVKPRSAISGEPIQPEAWQKIQDKEAALGARPERPEEPSANMPPIFTKHLTNQEKLVEGSHVYIEAQIEPRADPNLRIEWYKNGKSLTTGTRIRTTFDFGLVTLSVNGVRPDDSGIYTCKAINLLGEAVSTCTIKVEDRHWLLANSLRPEALPLIDALEGPKDGKPELPEPTFEGPVFISHLNNVVCTEGENSHFECRVEPAKDPTLKIEFFANGKPLPTGSRFKGNHDFGFVTLDVNSCYAEDSGVYTVKATNSKGQASTSGTLKCTGKSDIYLQTQHPTGEAGFEKVKEVEESYASKYQRQVSGPEKEWPKPIWTTPLQPEFKLGEAQPLHLEATVEPKDDPHLRIEWFFNGKSLSHGSRFKMTSEFGFVTLDLTEVYERDQGIYTCKAWNRSGEAFTSTTIYCSSKASLIEKTQHPKGQEGLGKIQELEESLRREEQKVTTPDEGQPPSFTSKFQDIRNLSEGEIAHFEASLIPIGDQSMVVEWFYNGKPIEASHRIRTVHAFGMVVLEILGTKIEDSGTYTCRATNKWGKDEISVTLECIDVTKGQKPQFTTHIKGIDGLKDGDSAHFECTLIPVGDPTMKVEWFHNGHPIRHSTRIKQVSDFGFVLMDIAYTQSHDTGEYVCRAKNKYGEDFTRAHITCVGKGGVYLESLQPDSLAKIRELESATAPGAQTPTTPVIEPPHFITQITDITTLKEGQSAHFEARLVPVNDPNLKVEWYFNGKKLPHGHRYRTFHDFGIVILDILYCYAENSGEYEARATNLVGSDSTKAILKCSSKASLILESQLPEGMEGGLEKIQDLEDAMIRTRKEQVSEDKKQVPVFTVPLSNIDSLREGESAHFEARLIPTDDPRLKVEWFWNNKPLRTGSRFRTFHDFGFVILEISPVYPEDSGEYSCRATNHWGQAVTTSTMKVEGKRSIIIESQLPKGMEGTIEKIAELEGLGSAPAGPVPDDDIGKPPEFITSPTDQTLVEYSLAHFECRLIPLNDPSLRVEWFHNGKPLTAGSRFKTINDFGFVILEIAQIDTRDSGLYTCKATNKHGEAIVSCKLDVRGRQSIIMEPQLPNTFSSGTESIQKLEEELHKKDELLEQEERPNPPKFIVEIEDTEVVEGGKAHFECRVEPVGDPTMRIDWFFNGRPFATGSRVHMINDFGYIVLDMDYIYARDSGEYLCRATNKWGTATTRAALICKAKHDVILDSQLPHGMTGEKLKELEKGPVTEPGPESPTPKEPPKFITQISSATIGENEPVRFECRVEPKSDPTMRIEWYRNGKLLPSGHRYRTLFDMGFVSLDILYVYPEDSGEYVCRAVNAYGEDFTKATVSCKKIPSIILQNQVPKGMKKSEQLMQMEATIKKYTSEIHLTEDDLYEPERKQPPRFVTQIQDQTELVEMEATKFECQLAPVGDPNMKVEWFFNGKPLHHKNRFTPIYDFGYVAMNFGWVYPEDSGEYLCRATNLYGQDETRAIIKTTGKPGIIYESQLPKGMKSIEKIREMEASWQVVAEEKEEEAKEKEKPIFVSKPEAITVNEGECARFCCRVTGYPRPRVVWLINNNTVINGTRYRLTYDGMWHLDIPKTRQYDQGKIEVVARNAAGETRVETILTVKPRGDDYRGVLKNSPRRIVGTMEYKKPEWVTHMEDMQAKLRAQQAVPTFIREITDEYVNEEEAVTFVVQFSGNPLPVIIWYHDDKLVRATENVKVAIKDNTSSVTIKRVTQEDAGVYTCKASSDIGIAVTKAKLTIVGGPTHEEITAEQTEEKLVTEIVEVKKEKKKKKKKPVVTHEDKPRDSVDVSEVQPLESVTTFSETLEMATAKKRVDIQESVEVTAVASCKKVPDDKQFPTDVPDIAGIVAPIQESVTVSETTSAETTGEFVTETREEEFANIETRRTFKKAKVHQTTTQVREIEEKVEMVIAEDMLLWQAPLQELAQVDVMLRKGVTVQEVVTLYEAHQFPALRTAPAQSALVSLVERQGHSSLITEMVTHESLEQTLTGVFKAFLTMVERTTATVSEILPMLKPADFQTTLWETTTAMPVTTKETATETVSKSSKVEIKEMKRIDNKRREIKRQEDETKEGASLQITKVVEESCEKETKAEDGQLLFSICSYAAETDDALNLVEGERVYIIESINSDWWFVRKHLTDEKGWVPAVYLRDEPSYTLYVQKKLHEKIDKLPIFERPRPGAEVNAPKFVEKLQTKHVPDGATVQFECKVVGNPRPQITWFRQTAIIKPSHDFQIFYDDDNVATLIISEVFPEDAGTFTCVAKNAAGFASSTTELVVETPLSDHGSETGGLSRRSLSRESSLADILEGIPPTFSKKPKAKVVPVGSNVDLEVRLVAVPEPDITWLSKGKSITVGANKTIITTSDMHMYCSTLSLKNISPDDEGTYTILVKNREGEATLDITLKLKPKGEESPFIVEPLRDISATEGEGIILTAIITGSPSPKVTWTKDGTSLKGTEVSGDTYTFILRNVKPLDAGKYALKATNKCGTVETSAKLTVLDTNLTLSPEHSIISEANTVVDLRRDEEELAGFSSSVAQIREETKLVEKMVHEIKSVKETIQYIQEPDEKVEQVVEVVSKITEKIDKLENIIDDLVKRLTASASSGYISKETETTETETEFTKTVDCETQTSSKFNSNPSFEARNLQTSCYEQLKTLAQMKLESTDEAMSLKEFDEIKSTKKLSSIQREQQKNASSELKRAQAPLFVERFEEQMVQEKGTIRLTAKVIGNPIPSITWLRNNKTLLASPRITEMFDGEQILLEIENADSEQDSGDYKCVATNPVGSATHGAKVTIDVAKVTFTKPLPQKSEGHESYPLTLECETSHTVSTTWYHDGTELSGMDHRELVQEGRRQMLVFKRVLASDVGTYTCTVKDQRTATTLKVQAVKPDFVRKLEDFEVKEQECAVLEVEVSSEAADVIWEKDGVPLEPVAGKIEIEKRGPVHKLFIRSTSVHDEGEYTCRLGDEECIADVTVIELPPEILTPLSDTTIPRGEKALFEVELTKGDALVRWFKDDVEIQFSEHIQLSIDGKRQRLKIYQAKESDAGVYTCQVGDQKSTAKLSVQEPKVEFITRLPDVTMLPVGSDAEFVVELSRPDVEVKWLKKGKEIKPSDMYIISSDGAKHKLVVKKVTLEDQSDYSCIAMNIKTTTKLKIEVIETAPKILVAEKTYKVQKGEDVKIVVKFTGNPKPTAEWTVNGTVIKPSKRISSKVEEDSVSLTIIKVVETDVGNYTVKLKNSVGEASAELTLVIIDVPDAPGIPDVVEITDSSITLHWTVPKFDGNSLIQSYILEHHDKEEFLTWHEITDITSTTHKVTNLITGHEMMFRVSAVNSVGRGKTSDSSRYMKVQLSVGSSAPTVCKSLNDISASIGSSVSLECVFSGLPQPEVKWFKDGKAIKLKTISYTDNVARLTISKCVETSGGFYSCKATNSAGTAETSCKLTIQDIPTLHVDEDQLLVQVGIASQWKPTVSYAGYPKPEISWFKNGKTLVEDKRIKTYVDETTTTIAIYSTERIDSGVYTVKATNSAGTATLDLNFRVIDKPSQPEVIEIRDIDTESVTVYWKPPADDGGVDISKYSLEKCETSKKIWTKVADIERDARSYTVQRLLTNAEYMFRIFAHNPVGISEPIQSDSVTAQSKYGLPSVPEGPLEISGMTDTTCTLSWAVPFSDGGTPILDYSVERREVGGSWVKIGSTKELHIMTSGLKKGFSYEFKVSARNRVGEGRPLLSDQIIAGTKKSSRYDKESALFALLGTYPSARYSYSSPPPPSPPENVQVTKIASKSVTLAWETPLSNGGSELTGYVIEKQALMSNSWTKVVTLDAAVTNYTIENLKEKSEFYFRVFAENAIGLSFPTTTSLVSLKTHATVPSPPTAPLEVRSTGATSVFLAWGVPESDGGAPLEGYKVAVRDIKKTMWMEVGRVSADVQRLTVKDLQENHEYLIRIFARNEVGFSNPLESDEPFKVQKPTAEVEDTDLEELGFDKETPSLSFTTTTTQSWMREAGMDADIYSYSRASLLRRSEYFFRLWYYAKHLFK